LKRILDVSLCQMRFIVAADQVYPRVPPQEKLHEKDKAFRCFTWNSV
jgi:hypothetical protein